MHGCVLQPALVVPSHLGIVPRSVTYRFLILETTPSSFLTDLFSQSIRLEPFFEVRAPLKPPRFLREMPTFAPRKPCFLRCDIPHLVLALCVNEHALRTALLQNLSAPSNSTIDSNLFDLSALAYFLVD